MARKDWKKTVQDALDAMGDRLRDALEALEGLIAPPPELVPVPVPVRPSDEPRRR
ncbi:MAG: hypothetical protein H6733_02570 [Alphaproteobacteria bacterium]|nr:hypothetical protein [Alphaproteobacteria bacterium]